MEVTVGLPELSHLPDIFQHCFEGPPITKKVSERLRKMPQFPGKAVSGMCVHRAIKQKWWTVSSALLHARQSDKLTLPMHWRNLFRGACPIHNCIKMLTWAPVRLSVVHINE